MEIGSIVIGFLVLGAACFPRATWHVTTGWKYDRPENVEPSTAYLVRSSLGYFVMGVTLIWIGAWMRSLPTP